MYNNKRSVKKEFLALWAAPNGLETTRIGLVVSARAVGLATGRNRIKRILREVYRKNRARIKNGLDIVVAVRTGAAKRADYGTLEETFFELAGRARILS